MKKPFIFASCIVLFMPFMILVLFNANAFAHGVAGTEIAFGARTIEFRYSTGDVMQYAEIKVFAPSSATTEVLFGFTDVNGMFSFTPYEAGAWKIEAADGMGHKAFATITHVANAETSVVAENNTVANTIPSVLATSNERNGFPLYLRALLGISLILNIFVLYGCVRKKRNA